jgi:hypothetical protein
VHGYLNIYLNNSTANLISFDTALVYHTAFYCKSTAINDIDGDKRPDIVTADYLTNKVSVLQNETTLQKTAFVLRQNLYAGLYPTSVCLRDLDGDGKPDIVVTNEVGAIAFFRNLSSVDNINFDERESDSIPTAGCSSVAVGDMDGDGKLDLIIANAFTTNISVLRN